MKPYATPATRWNSDKAAGKPSPWNSLEIVRLLASLLTPITLGVLAATVNFETSSAALKAAWTTKKLDKNIEFWGCISPSLKAITRETLQSSSATKIPQLNEYDDKIDTCFYNYRPFLSQQVREEYQELNEAIVAMKRGPATKSLSGYWLHVFKFETATLNSIDCIVVGIELQDVGRCAEVPRMADPPKPLNVNAN